MAIFQINGRSYNCPLELTLSVISGKWKILILLFLTRGPKRYSEIFQFLQDVTHKVLAQQLRELEGDGLVTRTVYPVVPPKVEYALTEGGTGLIPALRLMADWGLPYYVEESEDRSPMGDATETTAEDEATSAPSAG